MHSVKDGNNVGSIVRTKSGRKMKVTILTNGCTHCDVATTLSRDIDDGTVSYKVSSSASWLRECKASAKLSSCNGFPPLLKRSMKDRTNMQRGKFLSFY